MHEADFHDSDVEAYYVSIWSELLNEGLLAPTPVSRRSRLQRTASS